MWIISRIQIVGVATLLLFVVSPALVAAPAGKANISSPRPAEAKNHRTGMTLYPYLENITAGFQAATKFTTATVDPTDSSRIYLGTDKGYIHFTHDGGTTWQRVRLWHPQTPVMYDQNRSHWPDLKPQKMAGPFELFDRFGTETSFEPFHILEPNTLQSEDFFPNTSSGVMDASMMFFKSELIADFWNRPEHWLSFEKTLDIEPPRPWGAVNMRANADDDYKGGFGIGLPDLFSFIPLKVNHIEVNPHDNSEILVSTNRGVYQSEDGGVHWHPEGDRYGRSRRDVREMRWHPNDSDRRLMCTGRGLWKTENDGLMYFRVPDNIVAKLPCHHVYRFPGDPDQYWVASVYGVWVSENGGRRFRLEFVKNIPGQRQVRRILFHPDNPRHLILVTREAIFYSRNAGGDYERVGDRFFYNRKIKDVAFGRKPGQFVVMTEQNLWKTLDGGKRWDVIVFGNKGWHLQKMVESGDHSRHWVLNDSELFEVRDEAPSVNPAKIERLRKKFAGEMSLWRAIQASHESLNIGETQLRDFRHSSRSANWLPEIQAIFDYRRLEPEFDYNGLLVGDENLDDLERGTFRTDVELQNWYSGIMAEWDFSGLVFDEDELPNGRVYEEAEHFHHTLRNQVRRAYMERRRLQLRALSDPKEGPKARMFRRQRIRELTHHLDILTNGAFSNELN